MNRILISFGILLMLFLVLRCKTAIEKNSHLQINSDSLANVVEDSIKRNDLWIKYTYSERQGKRIFDNYCVVCHGKTGEGDGFNAYNLSPRPHSFSDSSYWAAISDETLGGIIALGGRGGNKSVLMPAYQNTLTESQILNLIAYIRTLSLSKPEKR
jgi:cytochrome c553